MYTTVMGFDYGTKYIGVALGQTITRTARPLTTLACEPEAVFWSSLHELIQTWRPQVLVVGLPLNMDGTSQWTTDLAKAFAQTLKQQTQLPVENVDERLTTVEARSRVFEQGGYQALQKQTIDAEAAVAIIESWLEDNV